MFLRRFFEPKLAQTSYLIGCASAGEAIVIDPNRDVEPYIAAAAAEHARITAITETHIHADFVSGARELAARTGAAMYLSDEGDAGWKYGFDGPGRVVPIRNGDRIQIGSVRIDVVHTPGHTPEHVTFLVTDGATTQEPLGAATGDFIFVGDVGRPDLLEKAASLKGTMESGARTLYRSLRAFEGRPDWLQIWPGHGAGSACGKGISAIPQSTLGYERRFNWAFQVHDESAFVSNVLAGQPDPPKYFARMKQINKEGPRVLGGFHRPPLLDTDALADRIAKGALVVDTRHANDYAIGHVPGTINIPLNGSFTTWAGWLVPYGAEFFVIASAQTAIDAVVHDLAMIGLDQLAGFFDVHVIEEWARRGHPLGTIPRVGIADLAQSLSHGGATLLDVRNENEWTTVGHIPGAIHVPLGRLLDRLDEVPKTRPVIVQCQSGNRSAIGASLLRAHGYGTVVNFAPGISGWLQEGRPVQM